MNASANPLAHSRGKEKYVGGSRPYSHLLCVLLVGLLCVGCRGDDQTASTDTGPQADTVSVYKNGTPKQVTIQEGDTVVERRHYRKTGTVEKVVAADSVQTYFDLHDPDSASVLKDYLQGHWQNLAADTSREQASAFYVFGENQLTFENPDRRAIESLGITYKNNRTLETDDGMSVQATILSFDTVHVTGYTLVRRSPSDSL